MTATLPAALNGAHTLSHVPAWTVELIAALAGRGPVMAVDHGVTSDGATDDRAALTDALAGAAGRAVALTGSTRLAGTLTAPADTPALSLAGVTPGARLVVDHAGTGLLLEPAAVPVGTVAAAAVGDTTLTVRNGPSWTSNSQVGKWVKVHDAAVNPASESPTTHYRRVVANTATVLTLDHPIGYAIPDDSPAELIQPFDRVTLRNLTIDRTTPGAANVVIRCARAVELDNVTILNAGDYGQATGNGISIYMADSLRWSNVVTKRSGQFGAFIYHSDDVRVDNYVAIDWAGMFGIQLKDCRDAQINGARCYAGDGAGDEGVNLKCSGLNPAFDCHVSRAYTYGTSAAGVQFSSITNEGTGFAALDFTATKCKAHKCGTSGYSTVTDATARPRLQGWQWVDCASDGSTLAGFTPGAPRMAIVRPVARGCGYEGIIATATAQDLTVEGGVMRDNCQAYAGTGASRSSEILIQSVRARISKVRFERTTAGKAIRAVRDSVGAASAEVKDCVIVDTAGGYTQDYVLSQGSPVVLGMRTADYWAAGPPILTKREYTLNP